MRRREQHTKHHAWYAEQVLASLPITPLIEVWVAGKRGGNHMNGCQCVECTMMPSTNETESPVPEPSSPKQRKEPLKSTSNEFVKCLVCGRKVMADDFILPLLIIEEEGKNGFGFRAVIHQDCFYDYDERLISEDAVEVIEL